MEFEIGDDIQVVKKADRIYWLTEMDNYINRIGEIRSVISYGGEYCYELAFPNEDCRCYFFPESSLVKVTVSKKDSNHEGMIYNSFTKRWTWF